jgi:hypothetical protein
MNKKPLRLRWPYFLGQRSQGSSSLRSGNMPELIQAESEWPRAERLLEDILRWADDGGRILDLVEHRTARPDLDGAEERKSKR